MIHPTALIDATAEIHPTVKIGPYTSIGPNVRIAEGCHIHPFVRIVENVAIGKNTVIHSHAVIGDAPQINNHPHEPEGRVEIGEGVTIREHVTIHRGSSLEHYHTRIGNHVVLMVASHVGHDCTVEDYALLHNQVALGGHCTVGKYARVGGLSGVHQKIRIGEYAIVGGMSGVETDVLPYGLAYGNRIHLRGLNLVGLRRNGFDKKIIHEARHAYDDLFGEKQLSFKKHFDAFCLAYEKSENPIILSMMRFIQAGGARALCMPFFKESP